MPPPSKKASCIRRTANFSNVRPNMLIDTKSFAPDILAKALPIAGPKLDALVQKIHELDENDLKVEGHLYKHIVYTDVPQANYSIKILASALSVSGFTFAGLPLKSEEKLLETRGDNFAILLTKPFGKKAVTTRTKKAVLNAFNDRDKNVHGDLIRILCLSDAFREGIDTYDVKYVHLLEHTVTRADEKQAIGRATRFCGQKGLPFKPRVGWPLYVYRYNVRIPEGVRKGLGTKATTLHDMFLEYSNLDFRRINFAAELEHATADAAVDKALTEAIHIKKGGAKIKKVRFAKNVAEPINTISRVPTPPVHRKRKEKEEAKESSPKRTLDHKAMQAFIKDKYGDLVYKLAELKNMCVSNSNSDDDKNKDRLIEFTPSQLFVQRFFRPESVYKGLLLAHSVGTGKTASAVATASASFENEGYTILWVTRHSLKMDVYKNIFDQVAHIGFRERLEKNPKAIPRPSSSHPISKLKGLLSKQWVGPISYKQFSNLLLKNNSYYETMTKRNGERDPLRKTLVIIDEAHKLYSPQTVGAEKPDTKILEDMVQNSYKVSGKDSVRLLLMTATPFTEDPMEQLKLLNLLRPKAESLPTDFDKVSKMWLGADGRFTDEGRRAYMDAISGYVSFLDRSADARYFAQPRLQDVFVDMSTLGERVPPKQHDMKILEAKEKMKELRVKMKEERTKSKDRVSEIKAMSRGLKKEEYEQCRGRVMDIFNQAVDRASSSKNAGLLKCNDAARGQKQECKNRVRQQYQHEVQLARSDKTSGLANCKEVSVKESKALLEKELSDALHELNALKDEIKALTEEKNKEQDVLHNFKVRNNELLGMLKGEYYDLKVFSAKRKKLREELKLLADPKGVKAKQLRAEIEQLSKDVEHHQNNIRVLRNKQKLAKIDVGRAVIGNEMAQERSLVKCMKLE